MEVSLIPIERLANQTFWIDLNEQDCEIHVYERYGVTYMDLKVNDKVIIQGQICLNNTDIIQYKHLEFDGNLRFIDTQGSNDPYYTGFNERYALVYVQ